MIAAVASAAKSAVKPSDLLNRAKTLFEQGNTNAAAVALAEVMLADNHSKLTTAEEGMLQELKLTLSGPLRALLAKASKPRRKKRA